MPTLDERQINAAVAIVMRVADFRKLPAYQLADLERQAQELVRELKEKDTTK